MAHLTGYLAHNIILRRIQFVAIKRGLRKKGWHIVWEEPYKSQTQY